MEWEIGENKRENVLNMQFWRDYKKAIKFICDNRRTLEELNALQEIAKKRLLELESEDKAKP